MRATIISTVGAASAAIRSQFVGVRSRLKPLLRFVSAFALTASAAHAEEIRVVGSDLLAPALQEVIEETARREGWEVAFDLRGSHRATNDLARGRAAAALVLRDPADRAAAGKDELAHLTVGHLVALVVVAKANPLESITLSGLARLFGASPGQQVSRWEDVGETGERRTRNVAPAVVNETGDVAIGFFQKRALERGALGRQVERLANPAQLVDRIVGNRDTIGIVGNDFPDPRARLLPVVPAPDRPAVAPSPDAIAAGDYPLALPLDLVFPAGMSATMSRLVHALLSAEASTALEVSGFRPLPPEARADALASFSTP